MSQHTVPSFIRAQPADEMFALIEAVDEEFARNLQFQADLHGAELK
ncbi:MAG: hypothetical protein WC205_16975 [Opitutaceae bacterium]